MSYHILIVDDEALAIRGIESGVNWEAIGISQVFTAQNIRQAKEICTCHSVDLMLCDIEMPQGNGLELLEWVRENHPLVETIILTCHADFDYAQKALQLGILDYMLKTMAYTELESILSKAITKIEKDRKMLETSQFGELYQRNKPLLIEMFWMDIAAGKIAHEDEAIQQLAIDRGVPYDKDILVLPIQLRWQPSMDEMTEKVPENEILDNLRSILLTEQYPDRQLHILQRDSDFFLFILTHMGTTLIKPQNLLPSLLNIRVNLVNESDCELYFYVGNIVNASLLSETVNQLKEMAKNDVALKNNVCFLDDMNNKFIQLKSFDLNDVWSDLIAEKAFDQLLNEVTTYLDGLASNGDINSIVLQQFHQDFLQMIYSILHHKKIHAHLLFNDTLSINLFDRSTRTTKDMMNWVCHVITKIQDNSLSDKDSLTVVQKVKRYVQEHITDMPSRDEIANLVYLNPDYLTRLFKKETGMTFIEYSQYLRIEYAKELLTKTDISISKVATKIGYSNFSHFSRAFKKITGISPSDYKNRVASK